MVSDEVVKQPATISKRCEVEVLKSGWSKKVIWSDRKKRRWSNEVRRESEKESERESEKESEREHETTTNESLVCFQSTFDIQAWRLENGKVRGNTIRERERENEREKSLLSLSRQITLTITPI